MCRGQRQSAIRVGIVDKLGIGLVDDEKHVGRELRMKARHLVARQETAKRIIRIIEQDDPGPPAHRGKQRVHRHGITRRVGQDRLRTDLHR